MNQYRVFNHISSKHGTIVNATPLPPPSSQYLITDTRQVYHQSELHLVGDEPPPPPARYHILDVSHTHDHLAAVIKDREDGGHVVAEIPHFPDARLVCDALNAYAAKQDP